MSGRPVFYEIVSQRHGLISAVVKMGPGRVFQSNGFETYAEVARWLEGLRVLMAACGAPLVHIDEVRDGMAGVMETSLGECAFPEITPEGGGGAVPVSETGRPSPVNDLRHTAVHEAGHAVIGRVLTMVCGDASVVADDDSAGHSITADPYAILDAWDRRGKWRGGDMGMQSVFVGRILTLMAGAEAEDEILGECEGGDVRDRYEIGLMLHEIWPEEKHDALEARLRRAARALARRHRADIERVAASLASKGAMTGEEIDAMLPPGFMARPDMWSAPGPAASPEGLAG